MNEDKENISSSSHSSLYFANTRREKEVTSECYSSLGKVYQKHVAIE